MCVPPHPLPPPEWRFSLGSTCGAAHSHLCETQDQAPQDDLASHPNLGFQKMRGGSLSRVSSPVSDCISCQLSTMMPHLKNSACTHAHTHAHTHAPPAATRQSRGDWSCLHFFNEISQPLSIAFTDRFMEIKERHHSHFAHHSHFQK